MFPFDGYSLLFNNHMYSEVLDAAMSKVVLTIIDDKKYHLIFSAFPFPLFFLTLLFLFF